MPDGSSSAHHPWSRSLWTHPTRWPLWAFFLKVLLSSRCVPCRSASQTCRLPRGAHGFPSVSPTAGLSWQRGHSRRRGSTSPVFLWRAVLSPGAALTKYYKLGGLKQRKCTLPGFWRPEVRSEGVSRAELPQRALWEDPSCLCQLLLESLACSPSSPVCASTFPPVRVCLLFGLLWGDRWRQGPPCSRTISSILRSLT